MPAYLDSSILVSLIVRDKHSDVARSWFNQSDAPVQISHFAKVEFASAVSLQMRRGDISLAQAQRYLHIFDNWLLANASAFNIMSEDFREAEKFVRRFELKLRGPDALHIATCARLKAHLITFDQTQAAAARTLGLTVEMPA
jgi:uncharacterized protein